MFSEFVNDFQFIYLTGDEQFNANEQNVISKNTVDKYTIYKIRNKTVIKTEEMKTSLEIKCRHDHPITCRWINKLPHDNWEELIDCWSCHKSEFKTLRDHKLKIIEGRIFTSDFYCIIPECNMPECCMTEKESSKLYFNEIRINIGSDALIYNFFVEYFKFYNRLYLRLSTCNYEIKYFYDCKITKEDKTYNGIKIGIKPTERVEEVTEINNYYREKIEEHLVRNKTAILVCGYEMTYVLISK